jgi:hypothetical protein
MNLLQHVVGHPRHGESDAEALQKDAGAVDALKVTKVERRDSRSAITARLDEPFGLKVPQRLAQWRRAHAERRSKRDTCRARSLR